jgi:poly-gamma-glutamate capsule biosynthesis protein CapA/YwtB (metallophosphatase superfamily)
MRRAGHLETYDRRRTRKARKAMQQQRGGRRSATAMLAVLVAVAAIAGTAYAATRAIPLMFDASEKNPPVTSPIAEAPATETTVDPVPVAAPEPSLPATLTISAVGDMLFDRQVKKLIELKGGAYPLSAVAERLRTADVTIGNLESMIASSGSPNQAKDVVFRGHPAAIEGLKLAGFDAIALANNHTMDYGPQPLLDTIATLDAAGIGYAGAGANLAAAWKPATIERDGATVAFFSFTHILPAGFLATDDSPGVASGKMDMTLIEDAVRKAKETHDYVIVSFHWGVEYQDYANADQVDKAHRTIDAGADMVLSHHPHVIQGVEMYKDRLIAYSLGDFVFDHYSRKTGEAFILEAELGPHGVANAVAVPVYLDDVYGRPEYVYGSEAKVILQRLADISKPHDTRVVLDGDIARIGR